MLLELAEAPESVVVEVVGDVVLVELVVLPELLEEPEPVVVVP